MTSRLYTKYSIWLFIGLQYRVLIRVMVCVYIFTRRISLELWAMFGAYVRLKWNCVALRKTSYNQQQEFTPLTAMDYYTDAPCI